MIYTPKIGFRLGVLVKGAAAVLALVVRPEASRCVGARGVLVHNGPTFVLRPEVSMHTGRR